MSEQKQKTKSWISFRVKPEEYDKIYGHFEKTTCRKLSEYARNILLQKPVTVKFRNQSADDFLSEIIQLKKELNAIGHNYNQSVKKLHTLNHDSEVKKWLSENEIIQQSFHSKTQQIFLKMDQIYRQWLSA
jgi:hypothetical protein